MDVSHEPIGVIPFGLVCAFGELLIVFRRSRSTKVERVVLNALANGFGSDADPLRDSDAAAVWDGVSV